MAVNNKRKQKIVIKLIYIFTCHLQANQPEPRGPTEHIKESKMHAKRKFQVLAHFNMVIEYGCEFEYALVGS